MQEAARLMASGDYESALPVALEAVTIGEKLFKPQPALQLFPLYLLAAQVCHPRSKNVMRKMKPPRQVGALATFSTLRSVYPAANVQLSSCARPKQICHSVHTTVHSQHSSAVCLLPAVCRQTLDCGVQLSVRGAWAWPACLQ